MWPRHGSRPSTSTALARWVTCRAVIWLCFLVLCASAGPAGLVCLANYTRVASARWCVRCAMAKRPRKRWNLLLDKLSDDHATSSVSCNVVFWSVCTPNTYYPDCLFQTLLVRCPDKLQIKKTQVPNIQPSPPTSPRLAENVSIVTVESYMTNKTAMCL